MNLQRHKPNLDLLRHQAAGGIGHAGGGLCGHGKGRGAGVHGEVLSRISRVATDHEP